MKNFLLVFRADYSAMPQLSPEEMQASTQKWMDWIGGIAAQNKLAERGNRLEPSGKVIKAEHIVTDGPYTEIKEALMGYSIIKADTYEDAVAIAGDCPILPFGSVEIRELSVLPGMDNK
jgi:hypothetical protein